MTLITLAGQWYHDGQPGPYISVHSDKKFTVNMSFYGRPDAQGEVVNNSTVKVKFPDIEHGKFTGKLVAPDRIVWSGNETTWFYHAPATPPADPRPIITLDGKWSYQGKPGPKITVSGRRLSISLSAGAPPSVRGYIINDSTISATFPGTKAGTFSTYTGVLRPPKTIKWSNNTAWVKQ